jgi:hypothetical protein
VIDDESTTSRNTDDLSIQLCRNAKLAVLGVVARHHIVRIASVSVAVKPVGKLDVRNGPVQFDERGRETTDGLLGPGQAPFLDSTICSGLDWQVAPVMHKRNVTLLHLLRSDEVLATHNGASGQNHSP